MKIIIVLTSLIILTSCNYTRKPTTENAMRNDTSENSEMPVVFNDSKDSSVYQVVDYLLKGAIIKPDSYIPLSWSKVEILNTPSFKFRVSHKFICSDFKLNPYYSGQKEYDVVFHLDSVGKVVSMCLSKDYLKYYSKEGLLCLYSSFEFEQIAIDNRFDQLYQKDNSNTISIVSAIAPMFIGKIGMTKAEFQKTNFKKLSINILKDIDTIDYCVDMSADDCRLYIFKNDTLVEIKNGF
jgi:hypothetical protein